MATSSLPSSANNPARRKDKNVNTIIAVTHAMQASDIPTRSLWDLDQDDQDDDEMVPSSSNSRKRHRSSSMESQQLSENDEQAKPSHHTSSNENQPPSSSIEGLSLRERMRLKVQEKIKANKSRQTTSKGSDNDDIKNTFSDSDDGVKSFLRIKIASQEVKDDRTVAQGAVRTREKRKAALKAPSSYCIDPLDKTKSLDKHPSSLQNYLTSSPSNTGKTKDKKSKSKYEIGNLLKEKRNRQRRGTDQQGFLLADAIAAEMDRERHEAAGIKLEPFSSDSDQDHRKAPKSTSYQLKSNLQVSRSPFLYWSSDSEPDDLDTHARMKKYPCSAQDDSHASQLNSSLQKRLAGALITAAEDEDKGRATFEILKKDAAEREQVEPQLKHTASAARMLRKGVTRFSWISGRILRPKATELCQQPILCSDQQMTSVVVHHITLAGTLPNSFEIGASDFRELAVWLFVTCLLESDVEQRLLRLNALQRILENPRHHLNVPTYQDTIPAVQLAILQATPRLLIRIGARPSLVHACFPMLDQESLQGPEKVDQEQIRAQAREQSQPEWWMTTMERTNILYHLVSALVVMCKSLLPLWPFVDQAAFEPYLVGIITSLALLLSESPSKKLDSELYEQVQVVMDTLMSMSSSNEFDLSICNTITRLLEDQPLAIRRSVLRRIPMNHSRVKSILRWIAYHTLLKGRIYDRMQQISPIVPDLDLLSASIDESDPYSFFYISPLSMTSEGGFTHRQTDFYELLAAIDLVGLSLSDLAVQICESGDNLSGSQDQKRQSSGRRNGLALECALVRFQRFQPYVSDGRIQAIKTIVARLRKVNSKILDNRGDVLLRSRAKDVLQRLYLAIEYQINMYSAQAHSDGK